MRKAAIRVAVVGYGAIGRRVLATIATLSPDAQLAVLSQRVDDFAGIPDSIFTTTHSEALLAWCPTLVVECAGHAAVAELGVTILSNGCDFMVVSVGALVDDSLRSALEAASRKGGRLQTVSGAIGGLDALAAARVAGIDEVIYTGRKPPCAWRGTCAEKEVDLNRIDSPTLIFEGTAADAARLYPKNANVTAAVALAGVGFERTTVRIFADPSIEKNVHELHACGPFGTLNLRLENEPLPDNPKTSWLAALSIEAAIRNYLNA